MVRNRVQTGPDGFYATVANDRDGGPTGQPQKLRKSGATELISDHATLPAKAGARSRGLQIALGGTASRTSPSPPIRPAFRSTRDQALIGEVSRDANADGGRFNPRVLLEGGLVRGQRFFQRCDLLLRRRSLC